MSTELKAITDRLRELGLLVRVRGDLPARIDSVTDDSRAANPGALFVAVRGSVRTGTTTSRPSRPRGRRS